MTGWSLRNGRTKGLTCHPKTFEIDSEIYTDERFYIKEVGLAIRCRDWV